MGLKALIAEQIVLMNFLLKSDQDGIESLIPPFWSQMCFLLKSDQDGIERKLLVLYLQSAGRVKIRPRWDWKYGGRPFIVLPYSLVKIRPRWDWKNSEIRLPFYLSNVKIRPRWDWKLIRLSFLLSHHLVKIRPRWDWKDDIAVLNGDVSLLKSDQDGIERVFLVAIDNEECKLKSDQDGIERTDCFKSEHSSLKG